MFRTRVKICGVTRVEDALLACELGADAIGMVMTPTSPRCVSVERARAIRDSVNALVNVVAVIANSSQDEIDDIVSLMRPDTLQFHGHEQPEFCSRWELPYIKAISMNERRSEPVAEQVKQYADAAAILLDGRVFGHSTDGIGFDWRGIPASMRKPLVLAGGIGDVNVASAIECVRPYAVDVSSGVESAVGIKDRSKLARLFAAVRAADQRTGA